MREAYQESGDGLKSGSDEFSLGLTESDLGRMDDLDDFLSGQVKESPEVAPEGISAKPIQYSSQEIYHNSSEFKFPVKDDFVHPDTLKFLSKTKDELTPEQVEETLDSIERLTDPNQPLIDEEGTDVSFFIKKELNKLLLAPLNTEAFLRLKKLENLIAVRSSGHTLSCFAQVIMKQLIRGKSESNPDFKTLEDFEIYLNQLDESSLYFFFRSIYYGILWEKDPQMKELALNLARRIAINTKNDQPISKYQSDSIAFLGNSPDKKNIPILTYIITKDIQSDVQRAAISALGEQPPFPDSSGFDQVNTVLIQLLDDKKTDPSLKQAAAIALAERPGKEATQALLDYFDANSSSTNTDKAYYAMACLSRREGRAVEEKLLDYLKLKIEEGDISNVSGIMRMLMTHADADDADNLWLKNEVNNIYKTFAQKKGASESLQMVKKKLKKWPKLGSLESKLLFLIEKDGLGQIRASFEGLAAWQSNYPDCKTVDQFYELPYESKDQWRKNAFSLERTLKSIDNTLRYLEAHGKNAWSVSALKHLKEKVEQDPILKNLETIISSPPPQGIRDESYSTKEWLFGKFRKGGMEGRFQRALEVWSQLPLDRTIPNFQ